MRAKTIFNVWSSKNLFIRKNYLKYKLKRLLTKDPSETCQLEYIIITNFTVSFFYYTDICFCELNESTHFN